MHVAKVEMKPTTEAWRSFKKEEENNKLWNNNARYKEEQPNEQFDEHKQTDIEHHHLAILIISW